MNDRPAPATALTFTNNTPTYFQNAGSQASGALTGVPAPATCSSSLPISSSAGGVSTASATVAISSSGELISIASASAGCTDPSIAAAASAHFSLETTGTAGSTAVSPGIGNNVLHRSSKKPQGQPQGRGTGGHGRAMPCLLMLIGTPGAGKSTFSQALAASTDQWVRVSVDECSRKCGGGKRAAEELFCACMELQPQSGQSVVLDSCSINVEERAKWLTLAKLNKRDKGVQAVFFDVPPGECKRRVASRPDHPLVPFSSKAGAIVDSFVSQLQPPSLAEGFEHVYIVRTFEDSDHLLEQFGARRLTDEAPVDPPGEQDVSP